MEEDITEKTKAELADRLGLGKTEQMKSTLFQGDFGCSIDFSLLIPILLVVAIAVFLLKRNRKSSK